MPRERTALPLAKLGCSGAERLTIERILHDEAGVVDVRAQFGAAYDRYAAVTTGLLAPPLRSEGGEPEGPFTRSVCMRLDTGKLAVAAMLAWAAWYTICAFLVAVAPNQTQDVFSYVFHYDLAGARPITWTSYLAGMISTTAWVGAVIASVGWCFNWLSKARDPAVLGPAAAQHR